MMDILKVLLTIEWYF